MDYVSLLVKGFHLARLYPHLPSIDNDNSSDPEFIIDGKRLVSFNSCNYLGLSNHPLLIEEVTRGFQRFGFHPSNSPHMGGLWNLHREFEDRLADFLGFEDALLFANTTMANMGVVPAWCNLGSFLDLVPMLRLAKPETLVLSDEHNHATIVEGIRLSRAEVEVYSHLDFKDLQAKASASRARRRIIVTDGVFSTDGRLAPLVEIATNKKRIGAELIVDDAHGMGILGSHGRGTLEHLGVEPSSIDVFVTCLSKGFGMTGAVVCGRKPAIEFLRVAARTYMYSRTFLAPIAFAGLKAIEMIRGEEGAVRRSRLWSNVQRLKNGLESLGFETMGTQCPIIPVLLRDERRTMKYSAILQESGFHVPPFRWPATPKKEARLRFIVTALHEIDHIDRLLEAMAGAQRKVD